MQGMKTLTGMAFSIEGLLERHTDARIVQTGKVWTLVGLTEEQIVEFRRRCHFVHILPRIQLAAKTMDALKMSGKLIQVDTNPVKYAHVLSAGKVPVNYD